MEVMSMLEPATALDGPEPDVSHLVTEDDTPVENWFQDKQMKLLTETLDVSWPEGRPFVTGADVGVFYAVKEAIVPDVLLSLGVDYPADYLEKNRGSYFTWVFGKSPDLVIEIVCNKVGGEDTTKLQTYAQIHVPYYIIYDPGRLLSQRTVRIYQLSGASYVEKLDRFFPEFKLGLTVWAGHYDGLPGEWLRWCDAEGQILATGVERSVLAERRANEQERRAEEQQRRAEEQQRRAEEQERRRLLLEAELRRLGVDPEQLGPG